MLTSKGSSEGPLIHSLFFQTLKPGYDMRRFHGELQCDTGQIHAKPWSSYSSTSPFIVDRTDSSERFCAPMNN